MKKHNKFTYGIIGLGRFGSALATRLAALGAEILVVDKDEEKVNEFREITENAFIASVLDKKTLYDIGIQNCDIVIVCIAELLDVSILTVMKLQAIGVKNIIAKATSEEHGEILSKLGVEVIYPERDMAMRLATRLEMGSGVDFVELSEAISITKVEVAKSFVNKSIREIDIRARFNVNIIAIESAGVLIDGINPEYIVTKDDIFYLCGSKKALTSINEWLDNN